MRIKMAFYLGLAALLVVSTPVTAQDDQTAEPLHKPQIYDYSGAPVDPLCFMSDNEEAEAQIFATTNCGSDNITVTNQSPLDPARYVSVAYETRFESADNQEDFTSPGFIGYRTHGTVHTQEGDFIALSVIENGGGSGVFSTLTLLDIQRDDKKHQTFFRQHDVLASGDRCNGGIKNVQVNDGYITYDLNMTMYDTLFLQNEAESPALNQNAVEEIPSCSICCYATGRFDEHGLLLVSFDPEEMHPGSDEGAARCTHDIVQMNIQNGAHDFTPEEFATLVGEIEHTCLGRVKGAE